MRPDFDFGPDFGNPYAPPSAAIKGAVGNPESSGFTLFLRWEKFRLIYNGLLGVETAVCLAAIPPIRPAPEVLFWLAVLAFFANICFCLGPVLDGYAHWMGLRTRAISIVIFLMGTLFAMLLTLGTMMNFHGFSPD